MYVNYTIQKQDVIGETAINEAQTHYVITLYTLYHKYGKFAYKESTRARICRLL